MKHYLILVCFNRLLKLKIMINIVTGNKNSGKTTYLKNLYDKTQKGNGFLCVKYHQENEFNGYNLLHLKSGEKMPFIRLKTKLPINWTEKYEIGFFSFSNEGFQFAENSIANITEEPIFIDEIGPLEIIYKKGFYDLLKQNLDKELYITVRKSLYKELLKTFNITQNINKITIK